MHPSSGALEYAFGWIALVLIVVRPLVLALECLGAVSCLRTVSLSEEQSEAAVALFATGWGSSP